MVCSSSSLQKQPKVAAVKRCVACMGGICGRSALAITVGALVHPWWQLVLGANPCPSPNHVHGGGAALWDGGTAGASGVLLALGKDEDEQKPFCGGEYLSGARTWAVRCLIGCADLKRINETQLFIITNEVGFS